MEDAELANEQRRQLIDTQQAFAAWHPARIDLEKLGTMRVQSSKGKRYMYAAWGTVRKSLGRETPELKKQKAAHDIRRRNLQERLKALEARLEVLAPVNRAMRLGRVPDIASRIIRVLDQEGLLGSHVIVAGTNALFAYETAAGLTIGQQHVATTDADLVWDTSQSLLLAATGIRREGLMGILRRVDKSFVADYGYNATNKDGYIVDLLCPESADATTMKAGADLEAVAMEGIDWLLAAPQFEQVVLGEDGWPLRLVVPEPRTFALHKLWVSRRTDRTPLKRPRDIGHARLVSEIAAKYLGLPFVAKEMPWLPQQLKELLPELRPPARKPRNK
jgi:hypothetical protein